VNTEALVIASGQNVKRLLTLGTRDPRRSAQVAALREREAGRPAFYEKREHRRRRPWRLDGSADPLEDARHLLLVVGS
jgi:hypothetical protein